MPDLNIYNYDLKIIDLNELFVKDIQIQIIDNLYNYNLLDRSINNLQVKKFFFHFLIHNICEKVLENKGKSIIYLNNTQLEESTINKYYSETEILTLLSNILRRIEKLLPVKVYISKYSIEYLNHLLERNDGKAQTTVNSMISKINKVDISRYTFSEVKKFTKRYELTFLNKDYFNRLSTKLLLIR